MHLSKALFYFVVLLFANFVCAQEPETKLYRKNNNYELAFFAGNSQYGAALSWVHIHSLTKNKRLGAGYGLRFTSQKGKNINYVTAPAILTSKQTGPQVLFTKIYTENVDTFFVSTSSNNLLNISINLQYNFSKKWEAGFNIDAFGIGFGKTVNGLYTSFRDSINSNSQQAKPTQLNLLLVSDNDLGGLNSELFVRYWVSSHTAVKLGPTFLFTEYTTDNSLRLNNNRWRNKALMLMIGFSFNPYR